MLLPNIVNLEIRIRVWPESPNILISQGFIHVLMYVPVWHHVRLVQQQQMTNIVRKKLEKINN